MLATNLGVSRNTKPKLPPMCVCVAVMVDYTTLECPVKVLGADPTMPFAYLPATHVSDFVTVDYDFLETTHFLQLEQPDACRDVVLEFLRERNLV